MLRTRWFSSAISSSWRALGLLALRAEASSARRSTTSISVARRVSATRSSDGVNGWSGLRPVPSTPRSFRAASGAGRWGRTRPACADRRPSGPSGPVRGGTGRRSRAAMREIGMASMPGRRPTRNVSASGTIDAMWSVAIDLAGRRRRSARGRSGGSPRSAASRRRRRSCRRSRRRRRPPGSRGSGCRASQSGSFSSVSSDATAPSSWSEMSRARRSNSTGRLALAALQPHREHLGEQLADRAPLEASGSFGA